MVDMSAAFLPFDLLYGVTTQFVETIQCINAHRLIPPSVDSSSHIGNYLIIPEYQNIYHYSREQESGDEPDEAAEKRRKPCPLLGILILDGICTKTCAFWRCAGSASLSSASSSRKSFLIQTGQTQ